MKWMMMNEKHCKTVEIDEGIRWKRCNAIPRNISEREQDDCCGEMEDDEQNKVVKRGSFLKKSEEMSEK